MEIEANDLTNPLVRMLAYAAVEPALRYILVLDASVSQLLAIDALLAALLAAAGERLAHGRSGDTFPGARLLSNYDSEDTLWGATVLSAGTRHHLLRWRRGILSPGSEELVHRVIVPNLAQTSLPVARAAIVAAGASIVHVERHGRRTVGAPRTVWLAGCPSQDLGKVSPHLLDRFSYRFAVENAAYGQPNDSRAAYLIAHVADGSDAAVERPTVTIADPLAQHLAAAALAVPGLTAEAEEVLAHYTLLGSSMRRQLVLARMAVAEARLEAASAVTNEHVMRAASMLGTTADGAQEITSSRREAPNQQDEDEYQTDDVIALSEGTAVHSQTGLRGSDPHPLPPNERLELLPQMLQAPASELFGEDHAPVDRLNDSLRLHDAHRSVRARQLGLVIGSEPATDLRDLAITATLLEAAKYQSVRRSLRRSPGGLAILPSDLRQHRRLQIPQQTLVLLVDYTALRTEDWPKRLMRHLQWAYAERASVHLIRVGAYKDGQELKADHTYFRTLLAPNFVPLLFQSASGRATPLAHGLALAQQTLLHLLQSGRSGSVAARFVILSDGRGNVTLAASNDGAITSGMGSRAIADVVTIAQEISRLKRVERILVDIEPPARPEYQQILADALGAKVDRPLDDVQC
ncbi:MAG: hypothetical protein U0X20_00580 [Caldilineaceae bacterium]